MKGWIVLLVLALVLYFVGSTCGFIAERRQNAKIASLQEQIDCINEKPIFTFGHDVNNGYTP